MANETFLTIRGNVARDPEKGDTRNGIWVRFSVGVTARVRDADGYVDRPTQWFEVRVYGTQAEHVMRSVRKGTALLVRGELRTDVWQTDAGEERSMQYVRAETVALDLHFRSYVPFDRATSPPDVAAEQSGAGQGASGFDQLGAPPAASTDSSISFGEASPGGAWEVTSETMGEEPVPVA